jgi:hypothetical protein
MGLQLNFHNPPYLIIIALQDAVVLKRKLIYAIESGAGFELS